MSSVVLCLGCAGPNNQTRTAPDPQRTEIAGSVGSSVFAGCQGKVEGNRSTIDCEDFVLLAIAVPGNLSGDAALDQAIASAGIETGRTTVQVAGASYPARSYELRNPGAERASVTAMVTAIPKGDQLLVMHCGSAGSIPAADTCNRAYASYMAHGVPSSSLAAAQIEGAALDFAGRTIEFETGCRVGDSPNSVRCENAELTWQTTSNMDELGPLIKEHGTALAAKVEARGGKITNTRKLSCLIDMEVGQCTETVIDLGLEQLGTMTVVAGKVTTRGQAVLAICSYVADAPEAERPVPCSTLFDY